MSSIWIFVLEQTGYVAFQMIETVEHGLLVILSFCQNESALKDGLSVLCKACCIKLTAEPGLCDGFVKIGFKRVRMAENTVLASISNVGRIAMDFLNHCANKTCEFRDIPLNELSAKANVSEDPIRRFRRLMIRC